MIPETPNEVVQRFLEPLCLLEHASASAFILGTLLLVGCIDKAHGRVLLQLICLTRAALCSTGGDAGIKNPGRRVLFHAVGVERHVVAQPTDKMHR